MADQYTRRDFIKISAGTAGAAAIAGGLTTNWWGLDADRVPDPGTEGERVVSTFCELCFWKCGVQAHVKDGRVTKIVGNPRHPLSKGRLCPRGTGGTGLLYDPDRLKTPLVRVKERGQDVFKQASWDEALGLVAERLDKVREEHGPEALALFTHGFGGSWFKHLMSAYGSKNVVAPSFAQCRGPREVGYAMTYGSSLGSPEPIDIANARVITLIGAHLGENMHNTQVQELAEAIGKGAELVVVDPRFSTAAGKARYWLPIKPGTDIALLLAWMNVIITEKRYDLGYVEANTVGFEQLAKHVADKTPEWAWAHTGIAPELIRETARFIASARPASLVHPGRRTTWYGDDTQRARAMAILTALLGAYGRRGGYIAHSKMKLPAYPDPAEHPQAKAPADRPRGGTHYPLATETLASGVCDASIPGVADYDIKAWLVYGTNLLQSLPNPDKTREAIQKLDFIVAIDVLPAEITGWADVVLPEATYLERWDDLWAASYKEPFIAMRQPVVDALYDTKPGWWIAKEIGTRLGLGEHFGWSDPEAYLRKRCELGGYDFEQLRRDGVIVGKPDPTCEEEGLALAFDTDSKKIELYSETMAAAGQPPMPVFTPPEEPGPGQLRLLMGRSPVHTFGRTTNNRFLGQIVSDNEVWLNADAAKALPGFEARPLKQGEEVVLVNQDGVRSTPVRVKLTQRIRGDCVYMVHGFGHSARGLRFARGRGASDSELVTRVKVDPAMGGTGMNVNFVRIERPEAVA